MLTYYVHTDTKEKFVPYTHHPPHKKPSHTYKCTLDNRYSISPSFPISAITSRSCIIPSSTEFSISINVQRASSIQLPRYQQTKAAVTPLCSFCCRLDTCTCESACMHCTEKAHRERAQVHVDRPDKRTKRETSASVYMHITRWFICFIHIYLHIKHYCADSARGEHSSQARHHSVVMQRGATRRTLKIGDRS